MEDIDTIKLAEIAYNKAIEETPELKARWDEWLAGIYEQYLEVARKHSDVHNNKLT